MSANGSIPFVDLVTPHLQLEEELVAVFRRAVKTGGFVGGSMVEEFEHDFARFCRAPNDAISLSLVFNASNSSNNSQLSIRPPPLSPVLRSSGAAAGPEALLTWRRSSSRASRDPRDAHVFRFPGPDFGRSNRSALTPSAHNRSSEPTIARSGRRETENGGFR